MEPEKINSTHLKHIGFVATSHTNIIKKTNKYSKLQNCELSRKIKKINCVI